MWCMKMVKNHSALYERKYTKYYRKTALNKRKNFKFLIRWQVGSCEKSTLLSKLFSNFSLIFLGYYGYMP